MKEPMLVRLAETERVSFGPLSEYQPIIGDDAGSTPVRTGIQTARPGYQAPLHSHPYVETLTVLEGRGEVWLDGDDNKIALEPGVTVAIPANRKHGFRALGDKPLVTLGIHVHGKRIVDYAPTGDGGGLASQKNNEPSAASTARIVKPTR